MVLPIYTFGQPVLREEAAPVENDSPELQRLIDDMIETMYEAEGIGLAAPQVGQALRVFVIDVSHLADEITAEYDGDPPPVLEGPQVFINPEITDESAGDCLMEEGCLSLPDLREDVSRPEGVHVRYLDRTLQARELAARGMLARVVQHEYDHLDGVLFVDLLSPLRRRLLRRRLRQMADGHVEAEYPLAIPGRPVPTP